MPKAEETSFALVIADARITKSNQLASFQKKTAKQLQLIARTEKENVTRRLFIGLALHVIKESFGHGNGWTEWTEKHVLTCTSQRQMHYMMAAAAVWIAESGLNKPEVAALPGGNFSLKVKDGPAKKLCAAAVEFVGDRTWGELLAEHEIRESTPVLGGARPHKVKVKTQSAEQLYLFARDELGNLVATAERVIVKENLLQHMVEHPEEALAAIESLEATLKKAKEAAKELMKK